MAQTRRKRQTKHRGNAAGVVESRGRTGRKPTAAEKSGKAQSAVKERVARQDRPPSWRGAFVRAMFAAVAMLFVLLVFKLGKPNSVIALFPIVLLMYWPISYYTDRWLYRRKQQKKSARGGGRKAGA